MAKVYRFTASWCNPCKALSEFLKRDNINITNVIDVDTPEAKSLVAHYGIRNVPTIIVDKGDGDFIRMVGSALTKEQKETLRNYT